MHDIEFVMRRSTHAVHISRVGIPARAREIVDALLAARGIPIADSLRAEEAFAERLARTGRYLWGEGDARVIVTHATDLDRRAGRCLLDLESAPGQEPT